MNFRWVCQFVRTCGRYADGVLHRHKDLRELELYKVSLDGGFSLRLPALDSLVVQGVAIAADSPHSFQTAFNLEVLPRLRNLTVWGDDGPPSRSIRTDRHAALASLAPQLAELSLGESSHWMDATDWAFWASCTSLRRLRIIEPDSGDNTVGRLLATGLGHLPASLDELDLLADTRTFTLSARNVLIALAQKQTSLSALKELYLPAPKSSQLEAGLTNWVQELAHEKLSAVAEQAGIAVSLCDD